jgi:hypothetical protein
MREQERRKDNRARTSIRFWYRMPWSREWHSARTEDIGLGGMSFVLPRGFCFRGLPIEVAVDVPKAAFRARGRVIKTRAGENGRVVSLSFATLPEHLRGKVRAFVDRFRVVDAQPAPASRMVFSL